MSLLFRSSQFSLSFSALYPQLDFSDEHIQRIVGIFDTNAIEIRLAQSEVMALYEMACMLEHSCSPNIRLTFDEKYNVSCNVQYIFISCIFDMSHLTRILFTAKSKKKISAQFKMSFR